MEFKNISCYLLGELSPNQGLTPIANHRLTLDLWLAKDNRFLNPKSSYKRILMAPPCRLIQNQLLTLVPVFDWQLILMESRLWCHHPFVSSWGRLQATMVGMWGTRWRARAGTKNPHHPPPHQNPTRRWTGVSGGTLSRLLSRKRESSRTHRSTSSRHPPP